MPSIGERIKDLRLKSKLTQKELSKITGISEISIRKYESGDRTPKIDAIEKLALALNVQIDYIIGRSEFEKFDSSIINNDLKSLIAIIESSNPEHSKLLRDIIDIAFLTVNNSKNDIDKLSIIKELYRDIWKVNLGSSNLINEYPEFISNHLSLLNNLYKSSDNT